LAGTIFPLGIDGLSQLPRVVDGASPIVADDVNVIRDATVAIETELGINPSGSYGTVKSRLDALDGGAGDGYANQWFDTGVDDILNINAGDVIIGGTGLLANQIKLTHQSVTPGTPAAGSTIVYAKTDGYVYMKDDAGTEFNMGVGGSGGGSGNVNKVGTPVNNELGVWTGDGTIEGDSNLTWDASTFTIVGGLTQNTGAVGLTANAASSLTTSSGALTLTSAAAATWSTGAGLLSISGAGGLALGDGTGTLSLSSGALTETALASANLSVSGALVLTGGASASLGDDTATWEFDGAGAVTETGMTSLAVTPSGAITLTAGAASTWSTSSGQLTINAAGGIVFNEASADIDFRVEGLSLDNAIFMQGSDGYVGIGTGTLSGDSRLTVEGAIALDEISAPALTSGYGKLYAKPDGYMYFLNGTGTEYNLTEGVGSGSGDVTKVGTPVDNQVGVWTGDGTIEGDTGLTWDATDLTVTGNILPGTDDTYDLGSNTQRWKDGYFGPESVHVGTSLSDEGTISYNTSTNDFELSSTGAISATSNFDAEAGLDVTGGDFTHASGGTGNIDVSWDFSGGLVNSAGELLLSGGNLQLNDNITATFGTGDDLSISHNGTDSIIANGLGKLQINGFATSEVVFNETGADVDFRVEGDTRENLLFVDAGQDMVGINRTAGNLGATLDVDNLAIAESIFIARDNGIAVFTLADGGALTHEGGATFNETGADVDFRVEGVGIANGLFVQGSDGYVGIGVGTLPSDTRFTLEGVMGLREQASPPALTAGYGKLYGLDDGYIYYKNDAGDEYNLATLGVGGGGSGDVTKVGTPVNNQVGVWTGDGTIEGDANLTFDGETLVANGTYATGQLQVGGTASQAGKLIIARGSGLGSGVLGWASAADDVTLTLSNSSGGGVMSIDGSAATTLLAGGTEKVRVTSAGVAIGTSGTLVPTYNLTVEGTYDDQMIIGNLAGGGAGKISFRRGSNAISGSIGWTGASEDVVFAVINGSGGGELSLDSASAAGNIVTINTFGGEVVRATETAFVVNEDGLSTVDFRVEGSGADNAFFVQGSDGYVGVGTGTLSANSRLTVEGVIALDEVSAPVLTAGYGKLYATGDGALKFLNSSGTETDLTATGGNVTKVDTPVNNEIGVWTGDGTLEGDTNLTWTGTALSVDGGATFNETGADVDFRVEGVGIANALFAQGSDGYVGIGTGTLPTDTRLTLEGVMGLREQASPPALTAGYGKLYGLDDGYIYYKNDAGDEYNLATLGAGGGGSGDVTKVGTPVNNEIGIWTGDGTIEGDTNLTYDGELLISDGTWASGQLQLGGQTNQAGNLIFARGDGNTASFNMGWLSATESTIFQINHGNGELRQRAALSGSFLTFYNVDVEQMRIDNDGVGIGTTAPTYNLTVEGTHGDQLLVGDLDGANSGNIDFRRGADGVITGHVGWYGQTEATIFGVENGNGELRLSATLDSAGNFVSLLAGGDEIARADRVEFIVNEGGLSTIDFRVESGTDTHAIFSQASDGYVGIGTGTLPSDSRLTVEGAIALDEVSAPALTAGYGKLYATVDGALKFLDSSGTETDLTAAGGGNVTKVGTPVNNEIGVWTGDGTIEGDTNLTWSGTALSVDGAAVFNEAGADVDFRVEGDTRTNLFFVDAGQDMVGINRTAGNLGATLDVDNLAIAESIFIARDNGTAVFTVENGGGLISTGNIRGSLDTNIDLGTATFAMRTLYMQNIDKADSETSIELRSTILPDVTNTIDLGSPSLMFEDGYFSNIFFDQDGYVTQLDNSIFTKENVGGHIETAADKTYYIISYAAYAGSITDVVTQSDSGTATATVKINGVALGGTANSVSSSEQVQSHTTANTFVVGDEITFVITSNSAALELRFTLLIDKTS
jgi:hypothetical protein